MRGGYYVGIIYHLQNITGTIVVKGPTSRNLLFYLHHWTNHILLYLLSLILYFTGVKAMRITFLTFLITLNRSLSICRICDLSRVRIYEGLAASLVLSYSIIITSLFRDSHGYIS